VHSSLVSRCPNVRNFNPRQSSQNTASAQEASWSHAMLPGPLASCTACCQRCLLSLTSAMHFLASKSALQGHALMEPS
jgi:hypothetical protein